MKKFICLFSVLTCTRFLQAQTVSYDDVAVIVNDSSAASLAIGAYFQTVRNIPATNILHISCTQSERVDSATGMNVIAQIKNALNNSGVAGNINYLVTTKGVPNLIENGICGQSTFGKCSTLETEIALLNSPHEGLIGYSGPVNSPYFLSNGHFSHATHGIYLVTRLDGYTAASAMSLVDRGGPQIPVNKSQANIVLDRWGASNDTIANFVIDNYYQQVYDSLTAHGWNVQWTAGDSAAESPASEVLIYEAINYHLPASGPGMQFSPGSVALLDYCYTSETFYDTLNPLQHWMLADAVNESVACGAGNPWAVYFSPISARGAMLTKYLSESDPFNFAETFYSGTIHLSSWITPLGDPKTSLAVDTLMAVEPPGELEHIVLYPTPASDDFYIYFPESSDYELQVFTAAGASVISEKLTGSDLNDNRLRVETADWPGGIYFVRISNGSHLVTRRMVVSH